MNAYIRYIALLGIVSQLSYGAQQFNPPAILRMRDIDSIPESYNGVTLYRLGSYLIKEQMVTEAIPATVYFDFYVHRNNQTPIFLGLASYRENVHDDTAQLVEVLPATAQQQAEKEAALGYVAPKIRTPFYPPTTINVDRGIPAGAKPMVYNGVKFYKVGHYLIRSQGVLQSMPPQFEYDFYMPGKGTQLPTFIGYALYQGNREGTRGKLTRKRVATADVITKKKEQLLTDIATNKKQIAQEQKRIVSKLQDLRAMQQSIKGVNLKPGVVKGQKISFNPPMEIKLNRGLLAYATSKYGLTMFYKVGKYLVRPAGILEMVHPQFEYDFYMPSKGNQLPHFVGSARYQGNKEGTRARLTRKKVAKVAEITQKGGQLRKDIVSQQKEIEAEIRNLKEQLHKKSDKKPLQKSGKIQKVQRRRRHG